MEIEDKIQMIRRFTYRASYEIKLNFPEDVREEVETNIIMQLCDDPEMHISFKVIYWKLKQCLNQYNGWGVHSLGDDVSLDYDSPSLYSEEEIEAIIEKLREDFWDERIDRLVWYFRQKYQTKSLSKVKSDLYTERYSVYQKIKNIKKKYHLI